ncbi:hypothetical protein [Rhodoblastus sp.]|uniref:hypothetical protein n=1 Tax=Rhodoblastus sp. TaxID=1962975 RepID=UPI003F9D30E4
MRRSGGPLADLNGRAYIPIMIRVAISPAAFDAIVATLPVGSVGFEAEPGENGERMIWLDAGVVDRLARHARAGRELRRRDHEAGRGREAGRRQWMMLLTRINVRPPALCDAGSFEERDSSLPSLPDWRL